ncbi:DsrE family protein [Weissella paramesenteroides]|uniref:DsrE family protein n=1 Tax=Weissella paramesenteroides TaxID=1249 RepID=UPI003F229E48
MLNTIFHIDETQKWSVVISNLKHLYEWMRSNNESGVIELVINGEAISDTIINSKQNLSELFEIGIDVRACKNSMDQREIQEDNLQNQVKVVPSGVVELAIKQCDGFGYIKP